MPGEQLITQDHFSPDILHAWKESLDQCRRDVLRETRDILINEKRTSVLCPKDYTVQGWKQVELSSTYNELVKALTDQDRQPVALLLKKKSEPVQLVKGVCYINTDMTPADFLEFQYQCLGDSELRKKLNPYAAGSQLVSVLSEPLDCSITRILVNTPGGPLVANREYVFMDKREEIHNNELAPTVMQYGRSVDVPGLSTYESRVRGTIHMNGWFLEQCAPDLLRVQYVIQTSTGGWIPQRIADVGTVDQPLSILKLKAIIELGRDEFFKIWK